MAELTLDGLTKVFPHGVRAVHDAPLDVAGGGFIGAPQINLVRGALVGLTVHTVGVRREVVRVTTLPLRSTPFALGGHIESAEDLGPDQ